MEIPARRSSWRGCVLGSINGLIFGVAAEVFRRSCVSGSFTGPFTGDTLLSEAVDTADFLRWYFIPALSMLTFTGASYLAHSYVAGRTMSAISLWLMIGVMAITAWNIAWFGAAQLGPPSARLSSPFVLPLTTWATMSPTWATITSSSVLMLSINLIYGSVIQLSAAQYRRRDR